MIDCIGIRVLAVTVRNRISTTPKQSLPKHKFSNTINNSSLKFNMAKKLLTFLFGASMLLSVAIAQPTNTGYVTTINSVVVDP